MPPESRFCQACGQPVREGREHVAETANGVRLQRTLGIVVAVLVGITMVLMVGKIFAMRSEVSMLSDLRERGLEISSDIELDETATAMSGAVDLMVLLTGIIWIIWQHRAQRNLVALGAAGLRFTPGWVVGWWLIPIANVVMPWRTMRELWRTSQADDAGNRRSSTNKVTVWWATWIPFWVAFPVAAAVAALPTELDARNEARRLILADNLEIAGAFFGLAAGILAISLVLDVRRGQAELGDLHAAVTNPS